MKMKVLAGAALVAASMALTGCFTTPGVVMDKSKPIEQGGYTVVADSVSSTMWNISIFGFPLPPLFDDDSDISKIAGNVVNAAPGRLLYKKALAKAPTADALIEYSLDRQDLYAIFFMVGRSTLTGTPVKTAK